jgi:hypothetical protein
MSISRRVAKNQLLQMANEDVSGLYEAHWQMNTFYPRNTSEQNRRLAEELLCELIREGLVEIFIKRHVRPFSSEAFGKVDLTPISASEVESVLSEDASWNPFGPDDAGIGFLATEKGNRERRATHPN